MLFLAMRCNVRGEVSQRREDAVVVRIVGAQRAPVFLRDHERDFQQIDRVEPEPFPEQRRVRIDRLGRNVEVDRCDDQSRQLELEWRQRAGQIAASTVSPKARTLVGTRSSSNERPKCLPAQTSLTVIRGEQVSGDFTACPYATLLMLSEHREAAWGRGGARAARYLGWAELASAAASWPYTSRPIASICARSTWPDSAYAQLSSTQ